MASLRNLAISMLPTADLTNIAQALRFCGKNSSRPLRLIGLAIPRFPVAALFSCFFF